MGRATALSQTILMLHQLRPLVEEVEIASRYGEQLRIHWISCRGKPTRGGSPTGGFGAPSDLARFLDKKYTLKKFDKLDLGVTGWDGIG
jgi:hypothetical protein